MALDVQCELNRVLANVDRYVNELGMDGVEVVKTQTRLLTKQIIDHATPPDSLAQGRAAIALDLRKIFFPINEKKFRIVVNRQGIVRVLPKTGKVARNVADIDPQLTMASASMMPRIHYAKLNARGRVRGGTPKPVGEKVSVLQRLIIVRLSDFKKYRAQLQARVGKAKAGWIPAYEAVGGTGLPSWVTRTHPGSADREGEVHDVALARGEMDPRITITNFSRGMVGIRRTVLARTLEVRANAMSTHIRKLLSLRAKETGLA